MMKTDEHYTQSANQEEKAQSGVMPTLAQTSASRAKQLPKSLPNDAEMINGLLAVAHTARESLGADVVDVAHYRPACNDFSTDIICFQYDDGNNIWRGSCQ